MFGSQDKRGSVCEGPFLPPIAEGKTYTLVLDLDETLIHYDIDEEENEGYYMIRPGALRFLKELSTHYEIVIFTAAIPEYADWIVDRIDPQGLVTHKLYRQHTVPSGDYALKDITKLGRDLSKVIIVDNIEANYASLTPDNGITVKSWFDDMRDKTLDLLTPFFLQIADQRVEDVRTIIKVHKDAIKTCLEEGQPIPSIL